MVELAGGRDDSNCLTPRLFIFKESALRPILSGSRDVRLYICLSPFHVIFFEASHDQIPASHWSAHNTKAQGWQEWIGFFVQLPTKQF